MAFTILVKTKELMTFRKCGVLVVLTVKKTALETKAFITAVAMKIHFIF